MQPHEALILSFSPTTSTDLDAKVVVNHFSIPDEVADVNAKAMVNRLSIQNNVTGKAVAKAVSRVQKLLANLARKSVTEVYAELESDSDKSFEDNMRVITQNVMEIDDYMIQVLRILLQADKDIFPGGSTQWRKLHERFRNAVGQSRDLSIHLAVKIQRSSSTEFMALSNAQYLLFPSFPMFCDEVLPLFQDDYSEDSDLPTRKMKAFMRFAGADDVDGVDQSMEKDQEACAQLGREFDDLRVDIASFVASFEGSVRNSDVAFEKKIREIKEKLRKTDEALRKSRDPFQKIASWMRGARSSRDIMNELQFLKKMLSSTATLHDKIHSLLHEGLPIIHEEVDRLGPRMKVLGEIWAYLRAQAQQVRFNLVQAIGDELPDFLRPDIVNETRTGYLKLYICVEQYATNLEPILARGF